MWPESAVSWRCEGFGWVPGTPWTLAGIALAEGIRCLLPAMMEPRDALEGKGPQRQPQRRLGRRLKGVAKAVGGGYCRLPMPLKPALAVRGTVAGRKLGTLEGGGGLLPPFQCIPDGAPPPPQTPK